MTKRGQSWQRFVNWWTTKKAPSARQSGKVAKWQSGKVAKWQGGKVPATPPPLQLCHFYTFLYHEKALLYNHYGSISHV